MPGNGPSKKQLEFIGRLQGSSPEMEEEVQKFLREKKMANPKELSSRDASTLIDRLLSRETKGGKKKMGLTPKQLLFIENLMRDNGRRERADQMLKKMKLKSLNDLSLDDASEFIEELKSVKADSDRGSRKASVKQVKFIESMSSSENRKEIVKNFLSSVKKKSISDLNSAEASRIIETLKELAGF